MTLPPSARWIATERPDEFHTRSLQHGDLERALKRIEHAGQLVGWIEPDQHPDPAVRDAITLLTTDGRAAEMWRDLRADLRAAEERLDDVLADLDDAGIALSEQSFVHRHPYGEPGLDGDLVPITSIESCAPTVMEAVQARGGEQRRGNGAVPSAASIPPVEDRQASENQETSNHGTFAGMD
jgi:hypothetical protein